MISPRAKHGNSCVVEFFHFWDFKNKKPVSRLPSFPHFISRHRLPPVEPCKKVTQWIELFYFISSCLVLKLHCTDRRRPSKIRGRGTNIQSSALCVFSSFLVCAQWLPPCDPRKKRAKKVPRVGGEGLGAKARGGEKKETNVKPFGVKESKGKKQKKRKIARLFLFPSAPWIEVGLFRPAKKKEKVKSLFFPPFLFTLKALFPFFS